MTLRIGSLCSGVGMIDLAVESVFPGAELAWYAQFEPGKPGKPDTKQYAAQIMAHHWPGAPNLGDITAIDYTGVPRVDILTAGFPCTDVSLAGKRAGLRAGTRSGVWTHVARAIGELRPSLVLIENVRSLTSAWADSDLEPCPWCVGDGGDEHSLRALGAVLGDLSDLGFDAEWLTLPASAVGAPHRRERVFILAWPSAQDAHDAARNQRRLAAPGQAQGGRARADARGRGGAPASDAEDERHGDAGPTRIGGLPAAALAGGAAAVADALGVGRGEGWPEPAGIIRGPNASERGGAPSADASRAGREGLRPEPARRGPEPGREPAAHADSDTVREQPVALGGCGDTALAGVLSADACPTCGCGQYAHDAGGFCASCAACTDPEFGRPELTPADPDGGRRGAGDPGDAQGQPDTGRRGGTAPDPDEPALGAQRYREPHGPEAHHGRHRVDAAGRFLGWGPYAAAIERWEAVLGRLAPWPVDDRGRLSPHLPEFMMGLPEGWVTAVPGVPRNAQLHALGNGCVVQQAAEALRLLLPAYLAATAEPVPEAVAA